MNITICIPAYNEAPILAQALRELQTSLPRRSDVVWEILVVDNASTDGTREVALCAGVVGVRVLSVSERGKGAAIIAAAKATNADIFGFIDADLSVDPRCIIDLLNALDESDVVVGSRLLSGAQVDRYSTRTFSSKLFAWLRHGVLGIAVEDTQCGLKFTNRRGLKALTECTERGWFFDIEWLARAERQGVRITEVPVIWREFHFPGRKSKLHFIRDGFRALLALVRIRYRLTIH